MANLITSVLGMTLILFAVLGEKDLQVFTARGEGDGELDVLDETWEWWCAADEECDDGSPVRGVFG